MARVPTDKELELLRLVATAPCLDHEDERLAPYCDDASTQSRPDTFNACEDMGWIKSWHDTNTSNSTVEITDAGKAAIAAAQPAKKEEKNG